MYRISEDIVWKILEGKKLMQGKQNIVENFKGFEYPLKIVVSVEDDLVTVITCYPLKKGEKS